MPELRIKYTSLSPNKATRRNSLMVLGLWKELWLVIDLYYVVVSQSDAMLVTLQLGIFGLAGANGRCHAFWYFSLVHFRLAVWCWTFFLTFWSTSFPIIIVLLDVTKMYVSSSMSMDSFLWIVWTISFCSLFCWSLDTTYFYFNV